MAHELVPRGGEVLTPQDVASILAAEFSYVRVDHEHALTRAREIAAWIEQRPDRVFLGKHSEARGHAVRLKNLAAGDALTIEFGDSANATKKIVVIPGEPLFIG